MPDEQLLGSRQPVHEPPRRWTMADVALIVFMYLCAFVIGLFTAGVLAKFLGKQPLQVLKSAGVLLVLQVVAYLFAFLCARVVVSLRTREPFFKSIDWNYPGSGRLFQLLLLGLIAALTIQFISLVLPVPKDLPVQEFFRTRVTAILSMFFGVLVAPLAEEIFFRGLFFGAIVFALEDDRPRRWVALVLVVLGTAAALLAFRGHGSAYALFAPVLLASGLLLFPRHIHAAPFSDRRREILVAVVLTSLLFAFFHGAQLKYSWGPVLAILLVGLLLTIVRVQLNSVAASWIIHCGYNATLFLMMYAGTNGFRQLTP